MSTRPHGSDVLSTVPGRRKGFIAFGAAVAPRTLEPGLHVVATPIGNLGDVTLRALETLAAADVIFAEDTRISRRLLDHYAISTPLRAYHEHNAAEMRPEILRRLNACEALVLISDAGTPLISDPGYKLVVEATENGHRVWTAPGPSAVIAALTLAALPTDRFFFEGFLPQKSAARRRRLQALATIPATLVFYEGPSRLAASLADMADVLGARMGAVARELTKLYEEVRRADLASLATHYAQEAPRGEIVVVVAPPGPAAKPDETTVERELRSALATLSVKDAAAKVAAQLDLPRRDIYNLALRLGERQT